MFTTLTIWGISTIAVTAVVAVIIGCIVWGAKKQFVENWYKNVGVTATFVTTLVFIGFNFYILCFLGTRINAPEAAALILAFIGLAWCLYCVAEDDPEIAWNPEDILVAVIPTFIMVLLYSATIFAILNLWVNSTVEHSHNPSDVEKVTVNEQSEKSALVRSKLIEQNAQHTEVAGEIFMGAGSFTLRSDSDLKIYHVWQERDSEGTLHVNIAQDGEGKDDKDRDKAVIRDDVPQGTEPYIERIPVYETDPLLLEANDGKLCVKNQDNGCHVNAQRLYDKVIIHVPAGSVVPSVNPNLPVNK